MQGTSVLKQAKILMNCLKIHEEISNFIHQPRVAEKQEYNYTYTMLSVILRFHVI